MDKEKSKNRLACALISQYQSIERPKEYIQADFVRISIHNGRHAKVAGIDGILADLKLVITTIVELRPLQLSIGLD